MPNSSARRLIRRLRMAVLRRTLSQTTKAVVRDKLTYLSPARLHRLEKALRHVRSRQIPGDIVEFGIALGGSTVILAKAAGADGRSFHGFDVFGMIPPPTSDKDDARASPLAESPLGLPEPVIASGSRTPRASQHSGREARSPKVEDGERD